MFQADNRDGGRVSQVEKFTSRRDADVLGACHGKLPGCPDSLRDGAYG